VQSLERDHPGFVRRLLRLAATRGDDDPRGLTLLAQALGGRRALESAFARFARTALDDPLVGKALHARRTAKLAPGSRLVLDATVEPLSLRLWRVPASAARVTIRRTGGRRLAVVVRRGSAERSLGSGVLRLRSGAGSLVLLVIGGAGGAQAVRLTLTGKT